MISRRHPVQCSSSEFIYQVALRLDFNCRRFAYRAWALKKNPDFSMAHLCQSELHQAADVLLQSAILGNDLTDALEKIASVSRATARLSRLVGNRFIGLPSQSLKEPLSKLNTGNVPPLSTKFLLIPSSTCSLQRMKCTVKRRQGIPFIKISCARGDCLGRQRFGLAGTKTTYFDLFSTDPSVKTRF